MKSDGKKGETMQLLTWEIFFNRYTISGWSAGGFWLLFGMALFHAKFTGNLGEGFLSYLLFLLLAAGASAAICVIAFIYRCCKRDSDEILMVHPDIYSTCAVVGNLHVVLLALLVLLGM